MDTLNKDKAIKVVSNQAALWDANNALEHHCDRDPAASRPLRQHRLLGHHAIGRSAGDPQRRQDRPGEGLCVGRRLAARLRPGDQGNFYKFLSYTAGEQGRDAFLAAEALLEADAKPGSRHREYYTRPIWLDKSNASGANCYAVPKPPTPTTAARRHTEEVAHSNALTPTDAPAARHGGGGAERSQADVDCPLGSAQPTDTARVATRGRHGCCSPNCS